MGARSCGTSVQDTAAGQLGSAGHGGLSPAVTAEDSGGQRRTAAIMLRMRDAAPPPASKVNIARHGFL